MSASSRQALTLQRGRRDFLVRSTSAVLAAGALGIPRASRAAEPVNIGALYPTTGSFAQIGQGCVSAAKLAVQMVNDAGGIKSLGGAKLNLVVSDVQSDTTVTRTETDRLISGNKLSAIHGCFASALTLIASEVAERAKVPLLTGSSSDQLNKGRHYTFTPFARASQFAQAQLQMAKLVSEQPKVAVLFENTAFGTSTSNGLREQAAGEGAEIVLFEPYSAGLTDASPLINKVKSSGANMLFPVSYLNDLILIIRGIKQVDLKIAVNGGSGGFVIPDFYKNVGDLAEGLLGVAHWNHDINTDAQRVNAVFQKQYGEFLFEYAGVVGLSAKEHTAARDLTTIDQRRLEMARALATNPRLLLLDEVMAGLNPAEIDQAVALIGKLSKSGLTIVIVEHVMRAIMAVARHIVVLDHGQKIAEGTPRDVVANQEVIRAYLGTGYAHVARPGDGAC